LLQAILLTMKQNKIFAYGRHAVRDALLYAPRALTKVYLDPKMVDTKLRRQIEETKVPIAKLSEGMARSDMKSGTAHQGIIGSISIPQLMRPYEAFAAGLVPTPRTMLVLLNGVQDPHNVGAIIRTAAGFGATAVLMPLKGQAPVTGAVIKVSAGMAFRMPLVQIDSVKHTLLDLKKKGFTVYSLAGDLPAQGKSAKTIGKEDFTSPAVFVLGNEGSGIPEDIRTISDTILSIPMDPQCESLNVAAAAAVALYAWSVKHPAA
jgi:23S rRNA (guanosine2251-2'-O)-methyltransferase